MARRCIGLGKAVWRGFTHLVIGRRFMASLQLNKAAADRLDAALKELTER